MEFFSFFIISIFLIAGTFPVVHGQQPYIGKGTTLCNFTDNASSAFGYSCNGVNRSCQAYLTFRSQPPYNSVSSISALLAADASELARLNSVSSNSTFETNTVVLVPVTCSCSGQYYQVNTTYVVNLENTFFLIANDTFQGLSTCDALAAQNGDLSARNLHAGDSVTVPLRCACPTKNQTDVGVNYLLSYLVTWGQFVSAISSMFSVSTGRTLEANGLSESNSNINPFTTLLVPLQDLPTISQTIAPPPPPATPPPPALVTSSNGSSGNDKTWVYAVVGVVGGIALASVIGVIAFCMCFRKTKKRTDPVSTSESFEAILKPSPKKSEQTQKPEEFLEGISVIAQSLKVYSFEELQSATENFSPSFWIKGSVYRGRINGDLAAIKRMDGDVSKEIDLLNKISHFNLIRLSGICFNADHWYLVYEYAAKGPLRDWIHNSSRGEKCLNWTQRIQIALDVATGLNYIHNYTSPPYVHSDVKSSNVLLDGDFRAKIANFSLARLAAGQDGQFALTRHIVGTKGYMAPEYLENGLVSTKLDVYAFGVLLMEILTGKEAAEVYDGVNTTLSEVLSSVLRVENGKENVKAFMDPSLQGNYPPDLAFFILKLVDSCIKKDPSGRPVMDEIVQSLSRIRATSLAWEVSHSISGY